MLVTGASSGIGIETVRALHATGADIFMQARDVSKAEDVRSEILSKSPGRGKLEIIIMDLDSFDSIRKGWKDFIERSSGKLHVLVNNAGIGSHPEAKTSDGWQLQFGVNHLAHFLLFKLAQPMLLASAPSRVINVTSGAHGLSEIDFENPNQEGYFETRNAYAQSKAANVLMANEIERRFGSQNLHGISVHPGVIRTGLGRYTDPNLLEKMFDQVTEGLKSPEQGAATQVWAAVGKVWEGQGGKYLANVAEQSVATDKSFISGGYSEYCFDKDVQQKLWEKSCEWVGIKDEDT